MRRAISTNSATATGTPPGDDVDDVSDTDTTEVDGGVAGDVDVRKADLSITEVTGDDVSKVLVFTIEVENTGDTALTNVVVDDPTATVDCDAGTEGDQSTIVTFGRGVRR